MKHHKFRFGIIGNIKVLICRIFGHRLNDNQHYEWCQRCGLAYSEIYHKQIFKQAEDKFNKI